MTTKAIRTAFRKLDASAQADVLMELAAEHAKALADEDRRDVEVMKRLETEILDARPWTEVRDRIAAAQSRKRTSGK